MRTRKQRRAEHEVDLALKERRAALEMSVLAQIESALGDGDVERLRLLQAFFDTRLARAGEGPPDDVTPHERFLNGWRIVITGGLVLALFVVVVLILIGQSDAETATPYVSLLSGLAGIALGWMFAGAAGGNASSTRSLPSGRENPVPSAPPPNGEGTATPISSPRKQAARSRAR